MAASAEAAERLLQRANELWAQARAFQLSLRVEHDILSERLRERQQDIAEKKPPRR